MDRPVFLRFGGGFRLHNVRAASNPALIGSEDAK